MEEIILKFLNELQYKNTEIDKLKKELEELKEILYAYQNEEQQKNENEEEDIKYTSLSQTKKSL